MHRFWLSLALTTLALASSSGAAGSALPQTGLVRLLKIGTVVKDCAECPEMVVVPQVGRSAANPGKVFYVARYELTWREYARAVRAKVCPPIQTKYTSDKSIWPPLELYDNENSPLSTDHPVTGLGIDSFNCYVNWLKAKSGRTYRLPSAAEWTHFALAGAKTRYPWGDELGYDRAVLWTHSRRPIELYNADRLVQKYGNPRREAYRTSSIELGWLWPVGNFPPNAWGLYDVIGNAEEVTSEELPVSTKCIKFLNEFRRCRMLATRGARRGLEDVLKNPEGPSLVDLKADMPMFGGSGMAGYRIVRQ